MEDLAYVVHHHKDLVVMVSAVEEGAAAAAAVPTAVESNRQLAICWWNHLEISTSL